MKTILLVISVFLLSPIFSQTVIIWDGHDSHYKDTSPKMEPDVFDTVMSHYKRPFFIPKDTTWDGVVMMYPYHRQGDTTFWVHGDTLKAIKGLFKKYSVVATQYRAAQAILDYITKDGVIIDRKKFNKAVKYYQKISKTTDE